MADKCFGCLNKYKFREKPTECPSCRKHFCNKCLDRKKVKENGATCSYCLPKQQKTNKYEDSQILENFHERYYKHKNQGSPIVSRVQFDPRISQIANQTNKPGVLNQEDKELEQRFLKLREGRTTEAPSLTELQNQFDKFQGKSESSNNTTDSSQQMPSESKSEFEQTQNLIQQMKEEAELDSKLESHGKQQETDLAARFNALQGKEETSTNSVDEQSDDNNKIESSNVPFHNSQKGNEDPENLLNDLKEMAAQEKKSALQEFESSDIKSLLHNFKPTDDENPDINYPKFLEDVTPAKPRPQVSKEELRRLIAQAKNENKREAEAKAKEDEFHLFASKKISSLMADDSDEEEEVKSKPKPNPLQGEQKLNFNWDHFDTGGAGEGENKWDFDDDEEFDQQVQMLIEEMSAEVKLEDKLEASGMKNILDKPSQDSTPLSSTVQATGGDSDELPWCCMCNCNATVRCFDCDNDLYCVPCFSQCHERFGLFDHRYAPYEPCYKP